MKRINKIFSFILFFVLLISFSEAKLHFHFCSNSNSLLAAIHWSQSDITEMSCHSSIQEKTCCGSSENEGLNEEGACDNCTDLIKNVETDKNYLISGFNFLDDHTEIELLHTNRFYDTEFVISNFRVTYIVYHPPPESKRTSSWLC